MERSNGGPAPTSVLFVCLGNICRSPLAEGVFRQLIHEEGIEDQFVVDSAGTGAWHVGEPPDGRACMVAESHGIELDSLGRQVDRDDFEKFDVIVAMDRSNLDALERMRGDSDPGARLHLLREFDPVENGRDVPDPYYGGPSGFETVYQMIRRSCEGLLKHLVGTAGTL